METLVAHRGIEKVAADFVDLVLKHKVDFETLWSGSIVTADEMKVLFSVVHTAGFDLKEIILGEYYTSHETQKEYWFLVKNSENQVNDYATMWLRKAIHRVIFCQENYGNTGRTVEALRVDIEHSIPLVPIQLTVQGDLLKEYPVQGVALGLSKTNHTRDYDHVGLTPGVHAFCNSWFDRHAATAIYDVLCCRSCYLRVYFPKEVKTYGELRKALLDSHFVPTKTI